MKSEDAAFLAREDVERDVIGEVVLYATTVRGGTPVVCTPAGRDPDLPAGTVRVATPDAELVVVLDDWAGQQVRVRDHVRSWIEGHVVLRGAKVAERASDRDWVQAVSRANGR